MEMIEVGMGHQHHVDGRQIGDSESGTAQAFQDEQPAREVRIDDDALSANLHEEAGMPDEGDAELAAGGEAGFVSLAVARSYSGMAHQPSELGGALTKGRIAERLLDHPATEPGGWTGSSLSFSILVRIAAKSRVIRAMRLIYLPNCNLR